jgi:branched-subunit amino acid permease
LVPDLTSALAELTADEKNDECIAHAIKLRTAWSLQVVSTFYAFICFILLNFYFFLSTHKQGDQIGRFFAPLGDYLLWAVFRKLRM